MTKVEEGQIVYVASRHAYFPMESDNSKVYPCKVVRANSSSFYVLRIESEELVGTEMRFSQKTRQYYAPTGYLYTAYLSEADFEEAQRLIKEHNELKEKIKKSIVSLSLGTLRKIDALIKDE